MSKYILLENDSNNNRENQSAHLLSTKSNHLTNKANVNEKLQTFNNRNQFNYNLNKLKNSKTFTEMDTVDETLVNNEDKKTDQYKYHLLINCDDVKIEKNLKKTFGSSLTMLIKSIFACNPLVIKFFSALFYAISSFLIVVINKVILTNYQ